MTRCWTSSCQTGLLTVVLLGVLLAGCDSAPGAEDPLARPPVVSELELTPRLVQVDQLPREGENVRVSVSVSARAFDADGDLREVAFVVQAPVGTADPIAAGTMTQGAGGRWAATTDVLFPAALTGPYTVLVFASDSRGILGNELRGVVELAATSNPPVIESVEVPDRVQRPATGEPPVTINLIATVSDPDGLANIARVEVTFGGGLQLLACDDGGQGTCNPGFGSGDQTAGDGRFTLTIQVESTNAPGDVSLEFVAVDRSGLTSDPVTRVLTIE